MNLGINTNEDTLIELMEACSELSKEALNVNKYGFNSCEHSTLLSKLLEAEHAITTCKSILVPPPFGDVEDEVYSWYQNSTSRLKEEFTTTDFNDLEVFKSSLGTNIINYFNLKHYSGISPDKTAMRIIENVWRRVKND